MIDARIVACLFGFLLLVGCGGGGGSDTPPSERPPGVVIGTAYDGALNNSQIAVYSYGGGTKGTLLGLATTNFQGVFSLSFAAPDQPILIEASGGSYTEEATGVNVNLRGGQVIRAVGVYTSGATHSFNVTYLTNLAAGLAQHLISTGQEASVAISAANTNISNVAGFNIHITTPLNPTDPANIAASMTDPHKYGFLAAGISELTGFISTRNSLPIHELFNSISFANQAYNDIAADGMLDGRGPGGTPIAEGVFPLNASVYRHDVAVNFLNFARNINNQTRLTAAQVLSAAKSFNDSTNSIFGSEAVIPIDGNGPIISNVSPANGSRVFGTINIRASVIDVVGLVQVEFLIDGAHVAFATNLAAPSTVFNTSILTDAVHTISVRAVNSLGTTTTSNISLHVENFVHIYAGGAALNSFRINQSNGALSLLTSVATNVGAIASHQNTSRIFATPFVGLSACLYNASTLGVLSQAGCVGVSYSVSGAGFNYFGDAVYVIDNGVLYSYQVLPNGTLTVPQSNSVNIGGTASVVAAHPNNVFLYIGSSNGFIHQLSANSTSKVASINSSLYWKPGYTNNVTISPNGTKLVVLNRNSPTAPGSIRVYLIDSVTGALTASTYSPLPTPGVCGSIKYHPTKDWAYVGCAASVSAYSVASDGALSLLGTYSVSAGGGMTVDPSGRFLYVKWQNDINGYMIDQTSGALSSPSYVPSGSNYAAENDLGTSY